MKTDLGNKIHQTKHAQVPARTIRELKPTLRMLDKTEAFVNGYDVRELDEFPIYRLELPHSRLDFDSATLDKTMLMPDGKTPWPKGCSVLNCSTDAPFRNQGLMKLIVAKLRRLFGDNISWGTFTPDGEKYLKHYAEDCKVSVDVETRV